MNADPMAWVQARAGSVGLALGEEAGGIWGPVLTVKRDHREETWTDPAAAAAEILAWTPDRGDRAWTAPA